MFGARCSVLVCVIVLCARARVRASVRCYVLCVMCYVLCVMCYVLCVGC